MSVCYEIEVFYKGFDFVVVLWREVWGDFEEGAPGAGFLGRESRLSGLCAGSWVETVFDEPVGYVDVGFPFLGCSVLVEYGADGDVESGVAELLEPGIEAVDVGKGNDFAVFEDGEAVRGKLGFASCSKPEVVGHYAGADDGVFFGFYEGYCLVGGCGQQVLSEEALCEFPVLG